jgi:hypothetical protein
MALGLVEVGAVLGGSGFFFGAVVPREGSGFFFGGSAEGRLDAAIEGGSMALAEGVGAGGADAVTEDSRATPLGSGGSRP